MAGAHKTFDEIIEEIRRNVFISHISQEKAIAFVLKKYLLEAFRSEFGVFVASDQTSIGGGKEWFDHILKQLAEARFVLVLVSQESCVAPWINFEAGFGRGQNSTIIPIAVRDFTFEKLKFPLGSINGRYIADLEGIVYDISKATGLVAEGVDAGEYKAEILRAEASVTYRSIVVKPFLTRGTAPHLLFTIENNGNTDLDLLMLEVWVPSQLVPGDWYGPNGHDGIIYGWRAIGQANYRYARYSSFTNSVSVESLRPVLTRSMGTVTLGQLQFPLPQNLGIQDRELAVRYHVHVRNHETAVEEITMEHISIL